jgi:hypothetical protein
MKPHPNKESRVWWYASKIPVTYEAESIRISLRPVQIKNTRLYLKNNYNKKDKGCGSSSKVPA